VLRSTDLQSFKDGSLSGVEGFLVPN